MPADLVPLRPTYVDPFLWHKEAIAGRKPPVDLTKPQLGYYRRRLPGGKWQRVVIMMDGGLMIANVDGERVDPKDIWPFAAVNPVRYEDQDFAVRHGHWPDEPPPAAHNQGPPLDDENVGANLAALRSDAAPLLKEAEAALQAPGDQDPDAIGLLVDKLGAIATRADKEHEAEKRPFLERGRVVDTRWKALKEVPRNAVALLKSTILTPALQKRAQAAAEVQRKQREAMAAEAGPEAPAPAVEPPAKVTVGQGAGGKKRTLKTVKRAVIVDYDAVYAALRTNAEVKELLQALANKVIKAGGTLPGVEVKEEQTA